MANEELPRTRRYPVERLWAQRCEFNRTGQYTITHANPVAVVWCANRARMSVPQADMLLCFAWDYTGDRVVPRRELVRHLMNLNVDELAVWRLLSAARDFYTAWSADPGSIIVEDPDAGA